MKLNLDCRHYIGEKPCKYQRLCEGCGHYSPMGTRVLIVKLGAMGDVLRTTPLLPALRQRYPECHITWLVEEASFQLLTDNPLIDRLVRYDLGALLRLELETYDLAINLDKSILATGALMKARAPEKLGFAIAETGSIYPLNPEAEYSFELGLSDDLKFRRNTKTYQEFTFESVGFEYHGEEYVFTIPDEDRAAAAEIFQEAGVTDDDLVIGLNTGSGAVFATKKWTIEGFVELAELLSEKLGAKVALLGGKDEVERNREIQSRVRTPIFDTGGYNPLKQFAAIVGRCSLIVTGDTLALHLAIAEKCPVVALFGSTCHQEIELYGRGEKIVGPADCAPCYKSSCEKMTCMKNITAPQVFEAVRRVLGRA